MRAHVMLILTTICYAFIGIFVREISGINPLVIAFFRLLIGTLFLFCAIPFLDKNMFSTFKSDPWRFALLGFMASVNFGLYTAAFKYAPITNVVLLSSSYAFFAVFFAWLLMNERPTRRGIAAISIGALGIAIFNPFEPAAIIGNVLALSTGALSGMYLPYLRKTLVRHGVSTALWVLCFATAFLVWAPFVFGSGLFIENLKWLLLLGLLCTGLAQLNLNIGLQKVRTDVASVIILLGTPLAAMLGWGFFGEVITLRSIIGGAIILASVLYLEVADEWSKKHGPHPHTHK